MLSATVLESTSKFIRSLTHSKAINKPRASPVSTSVIGENHSIQANTKTHSSSMIQISISTMSGGSKKDASTLHLYLPQDGLVHFSIGLVRSLCIGHLLFNLLSISPTREPCSLNLLCSVFKRKLFHPHLHTLVLAV